MVTRTLPITLLSLSLLAGAGAWAVAPQAQPPAKAAEIEKDEVNEVEIKLTEAPAPVRAAAAKLTAAANVTKVTKETDEDITTYEVEFTEGGIVCAAVFSSAGEMMELERATTEAKLPAAVMAALKKEYPKATFANPQNVTKMYYEIEVVIDGKKHEIKVDPAGAIDDETKADEDENDEKDEKDEKKEGK